MNISEFCKIYTGTGFPMDFQGKKNGKYPFYKVSDISVSNTQQKIFLGNANNYIDELELSILKGNIIPAGTIVFAKIGEALKLNKRAITSCKCLIDNNVIGIKPDENIINLLYFYYYLLKIDMLYYSESTTLPSVRKSTIEKIKVKIPPINVQNKRVTILNLCHKTIKYKMELLHNLELLVKSRFVEMFGNPNASRTKYKLVPIHMVTDCMVPGRDKPKSFTGEIPWITINDLNINGYTNKSKLGLGLTIDEVKEVNRKCVPQGSVLMSCVGNLGLCSIASVDVVINQQLHSYQCNELINNLYLMYYLSFKNTYMNKVASSTTVLYMNKNACNNIPVLLPPIELQISFAKYLNQINKLKSDVQKSIDETQLLMDSLMQEYFG